MPAFPATSPGGGRWSQGPAGLPRISPEGVREPPDLLAPLLLFQPRLDLPGGHLIQVFQLLDPPLLQDQV